MPVATKNGTGEVDQIGKVLTIPAIRLQQMTVTIEGVTELITHRFGDAAQASIAEGQSGPRPKTPKAARDPEAEFRDALYPIDAENEVYGFPAVGIKKALVLAGGRFADEQMTRLRGALNVNADLLEIRGSKPRMRRDPVRLSNGVSSLAYRPGFQKWEMDVPVVFNSTVMSQEQVLNLFQLAGFAIGIGDWRPEKNGVFGQFKIGRVIG